MRLAELGRGVPGAAVEGNSDVEVSGIAYDSRRVNRGDLLSGRRNRSIVRPRQIGMYLAKLLTSRSLPEIGRRFGNRDHTTVLHAIRKIEQLMNDDNQLREEIERLRSLLPERIDIDPADLERGLAGLVLTLVEFLRQVLERQAIRRMEGGSLSADEVERVGLALMQLEQKIGEIAEQFGLDRDDIQLRIAAAS